MPKLPSGLHVGVCISPIMDHIKKGDFGLKMNFMMALKEVDDVKHFVSLVYYRSVSADGRPTDEYAPGFNLVDVEQSKVSWTEDDYAAFSAWQQLPVFQAFMNQSFADIQEAVKQMKVELPKNLHGLFD